MVVDDVLASPSDKPLASVAGSTFMSSIGIVGFGSDRAPSPQLFELSRKFRLDPLTRGASQNEPELRRVALDRLDDVLCRPNGVPGLVSVNAAALVPKRTSGRRAQDNDC